MRYVFIGVVLLFFTDDAMQGKMRLLKYLIVIIGILHLHVEAKALQTSEKDVKGKFDHMYENLYLKKITDNSNENEGQNYEMRYVPHVDGKPIFIPFDEIETITTPSVFRSRPSQLRHKPGIKIPSQHIKSNPTKISPTRIPQKFPSPSTPKSDGVYFEAGINPSEEYVKTPIKVAEYLKANKKQEKHEDHPIVIDVVTDAGFDSDNFNDEIDVIRPMKSKTKEAIKPSKHKPKENIPNYHAVDSYEKSQKGKISLQPSNHESPVVVDSLTEEITEDYDFPVVIRPFSEKHKGGTVHKAEVIKINKPIVKDNSLKTNKVNPITYKDAKIPEQKVAESDYKLVMPKQNRPNLEDNDSPVVVESFEKEITEDYDSPVVIRPFSEKHSGVTVNKKEVTKINKEPGVKDNIKYNKIKPDLYMDTKIPDKKATKSHYKLKMPKHTEDPLSFLSDVSNNQKVEHPGEFTEIKPHQYAIGTKPNDLSPVKNLPKEIEDDYPSISEDNQSTDSFFQDSDYGEDNDEDTNQDYDSPVIVEALVKKSDKKHKEDYGIPVNLVKDTTVTGDYDSPVVVEALVKKTNQKDSENYDLPIVSAALVQKFPAKHVVEQKIAHTNKYEEHPIEKEASKVESIPDAPVVVEALVKKNHVNKKMVQDSTKMKPPKSSIHSYYEDSSTPKNKQSSIKFVNQGKPTSLSGIKTFEDIVTPVPVDASSEDFFDDNDQFDVGSGIINERSSNLDDTGSSSSKSNAWPLLNSFHSQERNKFKKCFTPSDEPGNCMPIQMCPTPNLQLTLDDLLKKICAIDEVFIGICCPEFPAETLKVDWENAQNISSDDQEALETKSQECGRIQDFGKDPQSWPWMAPLISVSTRRIFCGGVLINEQYVLTAAHCTRKIPRNQIVVVLGGSEKDVTHQEFEVVEIKRHAQYNPKTMQNDLALLKLMRKVKRPFICLPDEQTFVGMEADMLGWQGSFAASKNEEKLLVISPQECRKRGVKVVVGENILCTESRTEDVMCNVDSGAPLVVKHNESYQVIGILTWNRNDCDSNFPALFTRVSHFKRWIENHAI